MCVRGLNRSISSQISPESHYDWPRQTDATEMFTLVMGSVEEKKNAITLQGRSSDGGRKDPFLLLVRSFDWSKCHWRGYLTNEAEMWERSSPPKWCRRGEEEAQSGNQTALCDFIVYTEGWKATKILVINPPLIQTQLWKSAGSVAPWLSSEKSKTKHKAHKGTSILRLRADKKWARRLKAVGIFKKWMFDQIVMSCFTSRESSSERISD